MENNNSTYVYIVTARRWGDEETHSYIVGWCYEFFMAKEMADTVIEDRGGKYAGVAEKVYIGNPPSKNRKEVYRAKSQAE